LRYKYTAAIYKRILLILLYSVLLAVTSTVFLLLCAALLADSPFFSGPVRLVLSFFYYSLGVMGTVVLTLVTLFALFLYLFTRKKVQYLSQIMETVEEASNGNFNVTLPIHDKDELSDLARFVNQMAERLQLSIEEERQAVQAQNELITNVSHDLRTPLTSVIGYLRLIEEDRYRDEVELRHYVNIAFNKSKRLERMVNDLFEYTRVSYGGLKLSVAPINLIELIGQLVADYSLQVKDLDMEITLSFEEDKLMISADGDKLVRVFENLISNAIKYGSEGKKVLIKVFQRDDFAVIQFINYGSRIPSTDLPYLFERFYRIEKSRSEDTGGSGLGLAIAKNIIELHKGGISVSSDDHETIFEVKLPTQ
jgi:signal transduction histidine kinase